MNANELADELEAFHVDPDGFPYMIGEAITMLRQQQALIEQLEKTQDYLYKTHDTDKAKIEALKKRLENPVGAFGIERAYEAGKQTAQAEIEEMKTAVRSFFNDYFKKQSKKIDEQQAEIEALKQIIDANNLNQNIGQFVKPTNEPVAWMHQNPDYAISKHQSLEYNICCPNNNILSSSLLSTSSSIGCPSSSCSSTNCLESRCTSLLSASSSSIGCSSTGCSSPNCLESRHTSLFSTSRASSSSISCLSANCSSSYFKSSRSILWP